MLLVRSSTSKRSWKIWLLGFWLPPPPPPPPGPPWPPWSPPPAPNSDRSMSARLTASPFLIVNTLSSAVASGGWSSCWMSAASSGMLSGGAETIRALARVSALTMTPARTPDWSFRRPSASMVTSCKSCARPSGVSVPWAVLSPRTARCSTGARSLAKAERSLKTRISLTASPPGRSSSATSDRTSARSLGPARTMSELVRGSAITSALGPKGGGWVRSFSAAAKSCETTTCACSAVAFLRRKTSNCDWTVAGLSSWSRISVALATVLGAPISSTALGRPSGTDRSGP